MVLSTPKESFIKSNIATLIAEYGFAAALIVIVVVPTGILVTSEVSHALSETTEKGIFVSIVSVVELASAVVISQEVDEKEKYGAT